MMSPSAVFDLLRYAVGGSWASTAFGEPRFTNDVDILAEFTEANLPDFIGFLSDRFYAHAEDAESASGRGRPFNLIHLDTARSSSKTQGCRSGLHPSLHPKIFCWPNCIGSVWEAKYPRCSGATFKASCAGAPRILITPTSNEVPLY